MHSNPRSSLVLVLVVTFTIAITRRKLQRKEFLLVSRSRDENIGRENTNGKKDWQDVERRFRTSRNSKKEQLWKKGELLHQGEICNKNWVPWFLNAFLNISRWAMSASEN